MAEGRTSAEALTGAQHYTAEAYHFNLALIFPPVFPRNERFRRDT
jgi:hypothetical protein